MVFGGVVRERIQLNECSIWQGRRGSRSVPDSASALASIRRMLFEGRYQEGQTAASRELLCDAIEDSYQTLGDLLIESPLSTDASEYRRGLDIATCTSVTSWVDRGFRCTRTVFASRAAPALIVRQQTEEPSGLFVRVSLRRERSCDGCLLTAAATVEGGRARIRLRGTTEADAGNGVRFAADAIIQSEGGSIAVDGDGIAVRAANALTITIVAATDFPFVGAAATEAMQSLRAGTDPVRPDPESLIAASVAASAMPFGKLQTDHEMDWPACSGT
jgi:alpha-L-fucosidase 2